MIPKETDIGTRNQQLAAQLDCGDGVPTLMLNDFEPVRRNPTGEEATGLTAKVFAIAMTVLGQLLLAVAVAAGGSPLVGIVAAAVLMLSGLAMVFTETINARE